MMKHKRLGT